MIYHTRLIKYGSDYKKLFEGLNKTAEYVNAKYPGVNFKAVYTLAGERGKVVILTEYESLGDFERINAELDNDEKFGAIMSELYEFIEGTPIDQFYRSV